MKKRAQAAMEYLLVGSLITLIIIPTLYVFYSYSQTSNEEIKQSQINKVGTDIVDVAEQVYYLGEPSKVTIDATMPEGIVGIEVWKNKELVFFLNDGSEIAFKSRVNIITDSLCTEHTERCNYNFKKTIYSQGLKRIVIKAKGNYVIIGEGDEEPAGPAEEPLGCIDKDGDGYGVCPNCGTMITFPCKFDGDDCDDNNILIYPGAIEVCNGVDDDCDASTADGSGEAAPPHSNQEGVCLGSTQSCIAGIWQDNYTGVANYEDPETSCSDDLDNDCDTESDYDSQDGRHGDNNCKVAVTAIAVSDSNPVENSQIDVNCTVSPVVVDGFNSIFAYIDENSNGVYDTGDSDCGWNPGSGWNADFSEITFKDCNVGSAGSKQAACGVYSSPTEPFDRSYQEGDDQNTTINVISSVCSARTQSDCAIDALCEWCYECESSIPGKEDSTKYSGDVNRCVDAGNCVYNCENNECGASCDGSVGCTATECDNLNGCYEGTYRDYSDVPNTCQADCTCTANSCSSYTTIITDNDNDGYDIECDNDCNDNNKFINPGATEICNGVDDDCNVGTADGSGESAPDNSKQVGVCLGSKKSCSGVGGWVDDYTGVANYEASEATCYDGLDNDCDTLEDCNDIVNCEGSICTTDGTKICVDGPYGPQCVSI